MLSLLIVQISLLFRVSGILKELNLCLQLYAKEVVNKNKAPRYFGNSSQLWNCVLHISKNTLEMQLPCQMSFMWLFMYMS